MNVDKTSVADQAAVVDVLRRIEARHADPSRWCQGEYARDSLGSGLGAQGIYSGFAVATCLEGARRLECRGQVSNVGNAALDYLIAAAQELYGQPELTKLNDTRGYEAVRAIERRAIELAEQDAAGAPT